MATGDPLLEGKAGSGASLTSLTPANISSGTAAINISGNAAAATTANGLAAGVALTNLGGGSGTTYLKKDGTWGSPSGGGGGYTYSADDYGTHGTQAAIQAAIDAAELAGGGTVFISAGTWSLTSGLTITVSKVGLTGEGTGTTTLNATSGTGYYMLTIGNGESVTSIDYNSCSNMSFTASGGTPTGGINMARSRKNYMCNLSFSSPLTYGIRVVINCHWNRFENIFCPDSGGGVATLVWIDTSSAINSDNNPTMITVNGVHGEVSTAGVRCSGKAFGDLCISNVNTYGMHADSRGVSLEGTNGASQYYAHHINVMNVHHDGTGSSAVWAYGCTSMNLTNITNGGSVSNLAVIDACSQYILIGEGIVYGDVSCCS